MAKSRATVDAFYKAALAAGGRDNGPPGIRAHYHPDYYGAFVLDPDGKVAKHYADVDPESHTTDVLADIKSLSEVWKSTL